MWYNRYGNKHRYRRTQEAGSLLESTTSKYGNVISLAIHKLARGLPRADNDDLWQEAELALFQAGDVSEKLAYRIVERQIIDYLRKLPPRHEDIDDPGVVRKIDKQIWQTPNVDTLLDAELAVKFVNRLANPYKFILLMTFGVDGNPQFTEEELATHFSKSREWVSKKRIKALKMLKEMMC